MMRFLKRFLPRLRSLPILATALWAALASLGAAAAEPVFPTGLRVGLEPPGDMRLMPNLPRFADGDRNASITLLDLPAGAYEDLERSVFSANQAGFAIIKRESFPFASGIGFLVSGRAQQNGVTLHKWFLLAKSVGGPVSDLTTLINVEVPESALTVYTEAVVRKALASVTFRPAPVNEQLGQLPFKFGELAGLRIMQVIPGGGVILTDGPTNDINAQPYMIVSIGSGGPTDAGDRGRFARDMLTSAPLRDLRVTLGEAMRISGGPGFEIRATATDPAGNAVSVVQWLRFGGSGFLRVIGVSKTSAWDDYFMRFRAVRDGIEFR